MLHFVADNFHTAQNFETTQNLHIQGLFWDLQTLENEGIVFLPDVRIS
jgi:hypothetical protein